jgi:phosphatidylinositol 3,5-bisphosphate 5-phosphatase
MSNIQRLYILGSNQNESHNRILKIDRTVEQGELGLTEDDIVYTRNGATKVLNEIDDGNKATGGLQKVLTAWGIIGKLTLAPELI